MERLIQSLLDWIFPDRCPHEFAWPRRRGDGGHYQVCKRCGAEYLYDWRLMRRSRRIPQPASS